MISASLLIHNNTTKFILTNIDNGSFDLALCEIIDYTQHGLNFREKVIHSRALKRLDKITNPDGETP